MKKKIVLSCAIIIPIFIMAFAERSSSGAPASNTGAPGEKTCAASGCHDDNTLNIGTAKLSIDIASGTVTKYVAGETYPIKVRISDPHISRFGFQLVALTDQGAVNAGAFTITDPARTQFMKNEYELTDRKYITYTFSGTDAINGTAEWTVNWTAPATTNGNITFYAAAVSGNDDGTDKGDVVYTANQTLMNQ